MTVWHYSFFGGIILLNVMVIFRESAMKLGGWPRIIWTTVVLSIGAGLLYCIYRMRLHRLAKQEGSQGTQLPEPEPEPPRRSSSRPKSSGRRPAKKRKRR